MFMLWDGGFNFRSNEVEILEELKMMQHEGGIGMYLFQIGAETNFSNDAKALGIPVHPIRAADDFLNLSLQFSKQLYGAIVQ